MKNAALPIRLLIVDDHALMRGGIRVALEAEPGLLVVAEAGSAAEALTAFREHRPDVTLMDLYLPDRTGIEAIAELRRDFPAARFLMLTTFDGDEDIHRALTAGASGYILKATTADELVDGIRAVHRGESYLPAAIRRRLEERHDFRVLSPRELEVLGLLGKGLSNKEVGATLGLSEFTARAHVRAILAKLDVADRTEAVTVAIQRGLLHLR